MQQETPLHAVQREGQRARVLAPVRAVERDTVPVDSGSTEDLAERQRCFFGDNIATLTKCRELFDEPVDIAVRRQQDQSNQLMSLS